VEVGVNSGTEKRRQFKGHFLFLIIALAVTFCRWQEWFSLPPHYVIEPYGDAIKSYLIPLYHIRNDSSYHHFEGMNYPFGENIVAADGMATLSFPLKWLFDRGVDLTPYWPWLVHGSMLLSFVLGLLYLFRAGLIGGMPPLLSGAFALGIGLLSPQLLRMEMHFGLAHLVFLTAPLYYWLAYSRRSRLNILLPVGLFMLLGAGVHFYYVAFIAAFSVFFALSWYLLSRQQTPLPSLVSHLCVAVLLPLGILFLWLNQGNQPQDRCPQPWGFFQFNATPRGLLFSPDNPFWRWVDSQMSPLYWDRFADVERYHYLGLSFWLFCAILFSVLLIPRFRHTLRKRFMPSDSGFIALLPAGILSLLISLGIPFVIPGLEGLLEYTGPFRQFRSAGRFAWLFYYAMHLLLAVTVYRLFRGSSWALPVWGLYFGGLVLDITHYHRRLNFGLEPIPELIQGQALPYLAGIQPESYQAILTLPYFNLGSDQFWIEPEGFILQQSLIYAAATGLPTSSAMLSRSSRSQTLDQMQWMGEPYRLPRILNNLSDKRPFLLLVDKILAKRDTSQLGFHLLHYGRMIHEQERLALFTLPFDAFAQMVEDTRKETLNLNLNGVPADASLYPRQNRPGSVSVSWDEKTVSVPPYAGKGSLVCTPELPALLLSQKMPDVSIPEPWIFSLWVNISENKRSSTQFWITQHDGSRILREDIFPGQKYFRVFDASGWALLEIPWNQLPGCDAITVQAWNPDTGKAPLQCDELLLRAASTRYWKRGNSSIWLNNRRYPLPLD